MSQLYARKGEWVCCEQGHPIVQCMRDIKVDELYDAQAFGNWKQTPPERGDVASPCVICGSRWFAGMNLHFAGGFR